MLSVECIQHSTLLIHHLEHVAAFATSGVTTATVVVTRAATGVRARTARVRWGVSSTHVVNPGIPWCLLDAR